MAEVRDKHLKHQLRCLQRRLKLLDDAIRSMEVLSHMRADTKVPILRNGDIPQPFLAGTMLRLIRASLSKTSD